MSLFRGLLATTFVTAALMTPILAQESQTPAALCDDLAASPQDPETPAGEGVDFFDIEPIPAIQACMDAAKADPDNARLRYQLGRAYDVAEDFEKAHLHYTAAIERGSLVAMGALGQLYEFGLGVDVDGARAAELYEPAAEAGMLSGLEGLGKLYENGLGVAQDYARAARYYEEAADAGSYWAMAALGWLTENGFGVTQDLPEAARLYRLAAENGIDFAQNNLATFYAEGLGGVEKDPVEAIRYYTMAAEQGLVLAYLNLGYHFGEGVGVKKNLARAEEYFRKALAEGDADMVGRAQNNLAWMFAEEKIKLDEAEDLARSSVAAAPEDSDRLDTLAWVLHQDGRSEEALPIIEEAIRIDDEDPDFKEHLAAIQAAIGE